MKTRSIKILQILTGAYAALYLAGVISSIVDGELYFKKLIDNLFLLLFLIFLVGFALSWKRKKIAGVVFMGWTACIWIYDLFLTRGQDSGMLCILTVPVLVFGALFLLQWFISSMTPKPTIQQEWKFILRILLINYAVLYAIVVISELTNGKTVDYFNIPFIIFPLLLLLFLLGFALSWRREFLAGIIFLIWYLIILSGTIAYFEFRNSGPWIIFGIPILLQGSFYIKNNLSFRS